LTVILSTCVADCGPALLESVTFTVKLDAVFGPVGVPVMAPLVELKDSPVGRVPVLSE
jgi:hypothetical protein